MSDAKTTKLELIEGNSSVPRSEDGIGHSLNLLEAMNRKQGRLTVLNRIRAVIEEMIEEERR